jgi:Domain of unknown function (DUF1772)
MSDVIIDFSDLLLAGLLTGTIFGMFLVLRPAGLDAATYVIQQQNGIRALNSIMPMLGAITIIVTLAAAFAARGEPLRMTLLLAAAAALIAAGLVTRFFNQPINEIVMTWNANSPPAEWTILRDAWWRWHIARLGLAILGLSLIIAAALRRGC